MGYTPHVLVVGGGATGTGVARDLAIRGLDVTLVDRGPLASGTSGSMHALLHSGARYAADDPETAAACRRENAVLRRIGGHLVSETGGLFARLPADPADAVEMKLDACERVGIETEELPGSAAREREPRLAPETERAIAVPDAVVDPFGLCVANAISAHDHGADVRAGTSVLDVDTDGDVVDRVHLRNEDPGVDFLATEKTTVISPDYVVNATGPWADEFAALVGLSVPVSHSQGAMLVTDGAGLDTVVNRCRPRTEGDIAVPFGGTAVLGTTDRAVAGPDDVERSRDEIDHLVDELAPIVPAVATSGPYRAYWGVRALPPAEGEDTVEAARTATVLDHEARDGLWGMTTVFGGKLTTHRATAEAVADHVCAKFGIDRPCRTAELALPAVPPDEATGDASQQVDPTLCRARDVSRSAVRAVLDHDVASLGADLRPVMQLTRAGMGACQGGECAHRLATQVDPGGDYRTIDRALRDFLADRWSGRRHALWGAGFAGAMDAYDRHVRTLHLDGLPTDGADDLDWDAYDRGRDKPSSEESADA